jgi:polysaccharide biosynthesis/export protein
MDRSYGRTTTVSFRSLVACLVAFAVTGCANDRYYATNLPHELVAPAIPNTRIMDLSGLAADTTSDSVIDRGDVLEVSLAAGVSSAQPYMFAVRVDEQTGDADMPLIGRMHLAGLSLAGAEADIARAAIQGELYRVPHVTVTMKTPKMHRITVIGAVKNEGTVELRPASSNLLQALVKAGSLANDAGVNVEIRRPKSALMNQPRRNPVASLDEDGLKQTSHDATYADHESRSITVDLVTATTEGRSYDLEDGTVVMVERRDPMPVHVMGLVKKPNRYEYPNNEELRVLDAIAKANGVSNGLADRVFIIRRMPHLSEPVLIETSVKEATKNGDANLRLMPGDIVKVEHTPSTVFLEALHIIRFGINASPTNFL